MPSDLKLNLAAATPIELKNRLVEAKEAGQDRAAIISSLRELGLNKVQSICLVAETFALPLNEAKRAVHYSRAWDDVRERDEEFHMSLSQMNPELL